MTADLADWWVHPVTQSIAAAALLSLLLVTELLLRSLSAIGNVRFQGLLEDHPALFPLGDHVSFHLSTLLSALRWIQLAAVGGWWLALFRFSSLATEYAVVVAVLLPVVLIAVAHRLVSGVGEGAIAVLLKSVRPLALPLVRLLVRWHRAPSISLSEDEEEEASDREIQAFLDVGHAAGIIEADEGEILESLVEFFDTTVREVMTPRTEMVALPETAGYDELLEAFVTSHKSRIPIYRETIDNVVGVVHVKNLVEDLLSGRRSSVSELCHECLEVPESKELGELLRDFQRVHQQLAIVVDEYGGTAGLVTLEDILEEIVGEIQDEHDAKEPPEVQELGDGVYRLQGRAPIEVLGELFGVAAEEDEVDTVGGLVFSRHGTVPEPGTVVLDAARGLRFTVEEMQERRVATVTVRREAPGATADG